jgi:transcriptional regulator with XRE-family HTH domain
MVKPTRIPLKDFGSYLRRRREQIGLAQLKAAEAISNQITSNSKGNTKNSVSQSLLAQMEAGIARNPDNIILKALAAVYGISYAAVICELVKDKYQLDPIRADRLKDNICSIDELAEWEKRIKPSTLWIVAPNFIDDTDSHFASTVLELLRDNKTHITYFINEIDSLEDGRFTIFKTSVAEQLKKEKGDVSFNPKIDSYPLKREDTAWLSTSFVIANPEQALIFAPQKEEKGASGYYVLPGESGQPAYGLAINDGELRRLSSNLMRVINNNKNLRAL